MRDELKSGNRSIFSRPLQAGLYNIMNKGEQAILFLNRRGSAGFLQCRDCGYVPQCTSCAIALGYHKHFAADGRFPLGDPNPVKPEVIREGLERLKAGDVTLGAFFDGDGDRIDFYRGDGAYLSSSFVYAGILPKIRERFPGPGLGVYADLKSNPLAVMEMAKTGVTVNVIRNGHSQIKNAMFENPSMFGAVEESAHYERSTRRSAVLHGEHAVYRVAGRRVWREDPELFDALRHTSADSRNGSKPVSRTISAAAWRQCRRTEKAGAR
jgi:hypothetical protein